MATWPSALTDIELSCLGTGSGAMGRHTKNGGYLVDWNKVRTFVVPDLEGFTVCIEYLLDMGWTDANFPRSLDLMSLARHLC